MPPRGRPPVLDDAKRREILAILTVGCSRRAAAKYVGCAPATIANTAARDPEFAEQLRQAESKAEVGYLKNIRKAAKKEQYWRAAAWALERKYPERVRPPRPRRDHPRANRSRLLAQLIEIIVTEIHVPELPQESRQTPGIAGGRSRQRPAKAGGER